MSIKLTFVKQFLAFFSGFHGVWWCVGWLGLCLTRGFYFSDCILKCKDLMDFLQSRLLEFAFSSHFLILLLKDHCTAQCAGRMLFVVFWVWWLITCVLVTQLADEWGTRWGLVVVSPWFIHTGIKFATLLPSRLACLVISKWIWMNPEGEDRCQENGGTPGKLHFTLLSKILDSVRSSNELKLCFGKWRKHLHCLSLQW